ncbi:hypothetical protein D0Z00_001441 [Geotrichum galactomycetum]|uniref:Uncharacterized protein n=1 Tax=Geotrichum galactomycetum TaxID=27317 RepID=A0ACB6V764_9ASCO|nr:hypothetical protein D0Z00_001441 [Geotrichum candidum]
MTLNNQSQEEREDEDIQYEPYFESVVEQRLSNTFQGLLILGTMSRPLLVVLGLVPQAVLAGLFWIMGIGGLLHNGISEKLKFIFSDERYVLKSHPLLKVRKKYLYIFVLLELAGFAGEFGINQSVGGIGFPGVLLFFAVIGYFIPRFIPEPDMALLDQPTAEEFILENLRNPSSSSGHSDTEDSESAVSSAQASVRPVQARIEEGEEEYEMNKSLRYRSGPVHETENA